MYGGTKISSLPPNTTITTGFHVLGNAADGKTYRWTIGEMLNDTGAIGVSSDADNALELGSDGRPFLDTANLGEGSGLVTSVNGSTGAVTITIGDLGGIAATTLDANSILYATVDNTPAALAIAEDRMPIRVAGENIKAGTAAEIRTFLGVEEGATGAMTGAEIAAALLTLSESEAQDFIVALGALIGGYFVRWPSGNDAAEAGDVLVAQDAEIAGIFDVQRVEATETLTDPNTTFQTDAEGAVVARTNADAWLALEDASPYEEQATTITANLVSIDAAAGRKWRTNAPGANFAFADECWTTLEDQQGAVIITIPSGATGYVATAESDAITVKTISVPGGALTSSKDAIFRLYWLGTIPYLEYVGVTA